MITNTDQKPSKESAKRSIKALILDDNNFDRKRLRRLARQTGVPLEFTDCASLIAFEKHLDINVFQIVFIDYRLPEGNGLQALRILEKHKRNASAAPILIAGDVDAEVVAAAFKQGCADYIAKHNVDTRSLRHALLSVLVEN